MTILVGFNIDTKSLSLLYVVLPVYIMRQNALVHLLDCKIKQYVHIVRDLYTYKWIGR